jgi:hypothetical protein
MPARDLAYGLTRMPQPVFKHQVVAFTALDAISVRRGLCPIPMKTKIVSQHLE